VEATRYRRRPASPSQFTQLLMVMVRLRISISGGASAVAAAQPLGILAPLVPDRRLAVAA